MFAWIWINCNSPDRNKMKSFISAALVFSVTSSTESFLHCHLNSFPLCKYRSGHNFLPKSPHPLTGTSTTVRAVFYNSSYWSAQTRTEKICLGGRSSLKVYNCSQSRKGSPVEMLLTSARHAVLHTHHMVLLQHTVHVDFHGPDFLDILRWKCWHVQHVQSWQA